jgi:hypothetical protein
MTRRRNRIPKCAWVFIIALTAILHHAIGLAATIGFLLSAVAWVFATPAALVMVAALALWHLTSCHTPRLARARY